MSIKGFTVERLGLMIISLGFTAIAVYKIISLNNRETAARIDAVINDQHEFIAQWTIPESIWHKFLSAKLNFDIKESNAYGYITGGIVALILTFSIANSYSLMRVATIAVVAFIIVFVLVKFGVIWVAKRKFRKHERTSSAEIFFAKDLIIINGQLTILSDFGYRLRVCQVEEKFESKVLRFIVEMGMGHRKNQREYFVPIPENEYAEADRLVSLYGALID